jgi:porin
MSNWSTWLLVTVIVSIAVSKSFATECNSSCTLADQESDGARCLECDRDGFIGKAHNWMGMIHCLEDSGIKFDGEVSQFYQGVTSGGLQRKFRYGGHGEYNLDFDFGRLCGWDRFTLKLGAEHRFGENVNRSTGSVIPVALSLNLPKPETTDLALIEVRFGYELSEDVELFFGKLDTLAYDRNEFAHGDGDEKFFNTAFNYNPIATKTIPYSVLGGGFHVSRDGERVFTLGVVNSVETPTTIGISELFANGAVIFSELRVPVTLLGRTGHQAIGGSWSSAKYVSLRQDGRIDFPDIPIAEKNGSWSLFWNADQYLWQDPCDPSRGWGLFGRAGISDGNPNPIKWSVSFGIGGNSQLRGREDDKFGIGWYYIGISDEFGPIVSNLLGDGQGVELYYDIAVTEAFRLSIDLQVVDPNFLGTDTAVVPGVRGRIEF